MPWIQAVASFLGFHVDLMYRKFTIRCYPLLFQVQRRPLLGVTADETAACSWNFPASQDFDTVNLNVWPAGKPRRRQYILVQLLTCICRSSECRLPILLQKKLALNNKCVHLYFTAQYADLLQKSISELDKTQIHIVIKFPNIQQ